MKACMYSWQIKINPRDELTAILLKVSASYSLLQSLAVTLLDCKNISSFHHLMIIVRQSGKRICFFRVLFVFFFFRKLLGNIFKMRQQWQWVLQMCCMTSWQCNPSPCIFLTVKIKIFCQAYAPAMLFRVRANLQ